MKSSIRKAKTPATLARCCAEQEIHSSLLGSRTKDESVLFYCVHSS
jgi:hypothetical protein